jgi:hypothetical protein
MVSLQHGSLISLESISVMASEALLAAEMHPATSCGSPANLKPRYVGSSFSNCCSRISDSHPYCVALCIMLYDLSTLSCNCDPE